MSRSPENRARIGLLATLGISGGVLAAGGTLDFGYNHFIQEDSSKRAYPPFTVSGEEFASAQAIKNAHEEKLRAAGFSEKDIQSAAQQYANLPDDKNIQYLPEVRAYKIIDKETKAQSEALNKGRHPRQVAIREQQRQDVNDGVSVLIGGVAIVVSLRILERPSLPVGFRRQDRTR